MKNIKILIFFLLSIICMVSCDKDPEISEFPDGSKVEELSLKTSGEKIRQLSYNGGKINVWVESNTEWVCAIDGHEDLNLQIDKTKGYGDDVIVVTYASTRKYSYSYNLTGTLTIRWKNSSGDKSFETISFIRYRDPF